MKKNRLKEYNSQRKVKYPTIKKLLTKATQYAYKVGENKGEEYQCFYYEIEAEIDKMTITNTT